MSEQIGICEGVVMDTKDRIPDDKYRIIKIGKEALFELICEAFKEWEEDFFDVADSTTMVKFTIVVNLYFLLDVNIINYFILICCK